jgi:hypothetical protein
VKTSQSLPIDTLSQLMTRGEVRDSGLDSWFAGELLGLWSRSADGARLVASPALAKLEAEALNEQEAVAALFSCVPEFRSAWLSILAARLKEYGASRNVRELISTIGKLAYASRVLTIMLPESRLEATGFHDTELRLFGSPADQAVAYPRLVRALSATAALIEGGQGISAKHLPDIDPLSPQTCWQQGRLLRLPDVDEPEPNEAHAVLSGSVAPVSTEEAARDSRLQSSIGWVLTRPWIFLLAQLVFTQEAWAAERSGSELTLELPEDQFNHAHEPWQVLVFVTLASGEEVQCGTLGELIGRALRRLGVTLLGPPGAPKPLDLDARLSPVINRLLRERVWRIADFPGLRPRRGYLIDEEFSNLCYRAFGNRYFSRMGSLVTAAIRMECERWAEERLASVRVVRPTLPASSLLDDFQQDFRGTAR